MKLYTASILSAITLLLTNTALAYNNSYFKGNYAFRLTGKSSIVSASETDTVATGVVTSNGKGAVTGHGKFRTAGITCDTTIKGNYTIYPDGTGIFATILTTSTPGCFDIVLDLDMALAQNGKIFEAANMENDYMAGRFTQQ